MIGWTNLIFREILASEIWPNEIAGFLNQLYLQDKIMKNLDFLHADTNSLKLKVD